MAIAFFRRPFIPLLLILALGLLSASMARAADPSMLQPPQPRRTLAQILADWDSVAEQLRAVLPSPAAYPDAQARQAIAPTAKPILRKAIALNTEVYHASPQRQPDARRNHYHLLAILSFLDDAQATAELKEARENNHKDIALFGRHGWFLAQWWRSADDEKAADQLLDELEQLAKDNPKDDDLASILLTFRQEGVATARQDQRLQRILSTILTGPLAQRASDEFRAAAKRKSLLGKPLIVAGSTLAGQSFSTRSLKGKRVLVHFGATWCGPWEQQHNLLLGASLPPDLAVVTVLCDPKPDAVDTYLQRHNPIPWPVLRDEKDPIGFAAQFAVETLPNAIIIDADGLVIAVDAEVNDRLIDQLRAATAPPATQPLR